MLKKPQTKGLFTPEEMNSLDNLRGIPKEINSDFHLSKIRKEWNRFYKEFPSPTKVQLLSKRLEIDIKYGGLFNPPIKLKSMDLHMLEPEVSGEIGEDTIYGNFYDVRNKGAKPIIYKFHFVFSGWLGDDIIECTPCFIVTDKLKIKIEKSELIGYEFQDVEISLSDEFIEIYPDRDMPRFYRLIPKGSVLVEGGNYDSWTGDDFNFSDKSFLVVSERVLNLLREFNIDNCDLYKLLPKAGSTNSRLTT